MKYQTECLFDKNYRSFFATKHSAVMSQGSLDLISWWRLFGTKIKHAKYIAVILGRTLRNFEILTVADDKVFSGHGNYFIYGAFYFLRIKIDFVDDRKVKNNR